MVTRTVNQARNPKWADPTGYRIDLEVDFDELDEIFVPFSASKDSDHDYSIDLFNRAVAGEFGPIAEYEPPVVSADDAIRLMRNKRDQLLVETDYIEMPSKWATLTVEQQTAWASYRNALRDLPQSVQSPEYVVEQTVLEENGRFFVTQFVPSNFSFPEKPTL